MKILKQSTLLLMSLFAFIMTSCSDSNSDGDDFTPRTFNVSGKVEKGPFVNGSTITIQPMDSKLQVLGSMFNTTITDNIGNFTFGSKEFQAPYAEMMATGYFFNEVRGSLSDGVLVLRALVDLSDNSTVNVNILTHLKYPRIKKLIASGKSFKDANTQAQKELLSAFGLQKYASKDASQFSIVAGTDESAALIAVSSLLLINRSEGALTEYLSTLSEEFGVNGEFSEATKAQIKKDKQELSSQLSNIQSHIISRYSELGMEVTVKNLGKYFDWDDDGIAGNETLKEGESVSLDVNKISVPKEGGSYTIAINSPIPVYLTPSVFNDPTAVSGNESSVYYNSIYEDVENTDISIDATIDNKTLKISVAKSQSRMEQISTVYIYDCLGNVVATVIVTQEGEKSAKIPLLGKDAKNAVNAMCESLRDAYKNYNILEQYYFYNKESKMIPLSSNDSYISNCWSNFFKANNLCLTFKKVEAQKLGVYQDYFNVFYAMYYYTMIVAWGDVPYNYGSTWGDIWSIPRTNKDDILTDLKQQLTEAIETLDEKKNQSLTDTNGFFFVSKDVARILLANIYMYQGDWSTAKPLLAKVRSNGYYQLDATSEYESNSSGLIFGLIKENETETKTRTKAVVIQTPPIMPIQSLSDVYLSSAECEYYLGNTSEAKSLLSKVTTAKNISVSSDVLTGIKEARANSLLYNAGYFAFLKRNKLAIGEYGIKDYQLLFPIPLRELDLNPSITQNPWY